MDWRTTRMWEVLSRIPDWRRRASVLFPLPALILTALMAKMSGIKSLRGTAQFAERHEDRLKKMFGLHAAPGFTAIRGALLGIDPADLAAALEEWEQPPGAVRAGAVVAVDGKSVRSSLSESGEKGQKIAAVLSVMDCATGRVIAAEASPDGKKGEIKRLEAVLARLSGVSLLTADAQQRQKKYSRS